FPDHWNFFELTPSTDINKPTLMSLPARVAKIEWLQYDITEDGGTVRKTKDLCPLPLKDFFNRMDSLDSSKADVYSYDYLVDSATVTVRAYNNREHTYYTDTVDRTIIVADFDLSVGQTVIGNGTRAYGMIVPEFIPEDTFIPEFELLQFTLLFNEAK